MNINEMIKLERYKKFTVLDTPTLFSEFMKDQNIECVQVHSNYGDDYPIGFCGAFKWENNAIFPLDGDTYGDMTVLAYSWFFNEGTKCLDIVVEDW